MKEPTSNPETVHVERCGGSGQVLRPIASTNDPTLYVPCPGCPDCTPQPERVERLEAALREIADNDEQSDWWYRNIARAALSPTAEGER